MVPQVCLMSSFRIRNWWLFLSQQTFYIFKNFMKNELCMIEGQGINLHAISIISWNFNPDNNYNWKFFFLSSWIGSFFVSRDSRPSPFQSKYDYGLLSLLFASLRDRAPSSGHHISSFSSFRNAVNALVFRKEWRRKWGRQSGEKNSVARSCVDFGVKAPSLPF